MLGPLVILAVFALFFGGIAIGPFYNYLDTNFEYYELNFEELGVIGGHIPPSEQAAEGAAEGEETVKEPFLIQILPIIVGVGGILLAALFYFKAWKKFDPSLVSGDKDPLRRMLLKGYYQHEILTGWFAETVIYGASILINIIDIKLVDGWLNWLSSWVLGFGGHVRKVQTGIVQNYVTALALGIVILVVAVAVAAGVIL
jgi:NADH-quinone oxidoreductase subunit L